MIECYIFDIGNVLLFFDRQKQIRQVAEVMGVEPGVFEASYLKSGLILRHERGEITTAQLLDELDLIAKKSFRSADLDLALNDMFTENKLMTDWLKKLKGLGKKVLLLSNTSSLHYDYLVDRYDFFRYADDCVLSYEVRHLKPEPEIYQIAVAKSGYKPEQCLFVDDMAENIKAANEAGLKGVVYDNHRLFQDKMKEWSIVV